MNCQVNLCVNGCQYGDRLFCRACRDKWRECCVMEFGEKRGDMNDIFALLRDFKRGNLI